MALDDLFVWRFAQFPLSPSPLFIFICLEHILLLIVVYMSIWKVHGNDRNQHEAMANEMMMYIFFKGLMLFCFCSLSVSICIVVSFSSSIQVGDRYSPFPNFFQPLLLAPFFRSEMKRILQLCNFVVVYSIRNFCSR